MANLPSTPCGIFTCSSLPIAPCYYISPTLILTSSLSGAHISLTFSFFQLYIAFLVSLLHLCLTLFPASFPSALVVQFIQITDRDFPSFSSGVYSSRKNIVLTKTEYCILHDGWALHRETQFYDLLA